MNDLLASALDYGERGWLVCPIHSIRDGRCSCGDPDCGSPGKHPRTPQGLKNASADASTIRAWWDRWPDANVAIVTGKVSGLVVLDIDPRNGGDDSILALRSAEGLPDTVTALTGGGGAHYFFAYPANVEKVKSGALAGYDGIDVKADGGYVVAAPSNHASGRHYSWEASSRPDEIPFANTPAFLCYPAPSRGELGDAARSLLGEAFARAGMVLRTGKAGRLTVRCPWESEHTSGRAGDGSTILFPPKDGSNAGWFHCSHSHCSNRTMRDVLAALPAEAVEGARDVVSAACSDKPTIKVDVDLDRVVDEAIRALTTDAGVYQRAGHLVHVTRDATSGLLGVRRVATATLRERLAATACFTKHDKRAKKHVPCLPPEEVVQAVAARGEWSGIRRLVGLLESPSLRPDGTVIQDHGYDEVTGYLLQPAVSYPPVKDRPTIEDARKALEELDEVFADFPFARDAHRSAAIAMLLTVIARPAIDGAIPMGAIDATTRGTGKGRLVDAITNVSLGRDAPKTPMPEDDEETGKLISAIVAEGALVAVLDNIARAIDLPSLDNALTSTTWKQRALGRNETIYAPHTTVWFATGNNLEYGGDIARRVVPIRLESPLENPEEREDFKHPDLLAWVRTERPRLVRAALTILRAHAVAGRPRCGCKPLGSFEAWSALIPPALVWLGRANPMDARFDVSSLADRTRDTLVALLDGWARVDPSGQGMTVGEVLALLYSNRVVYPPPPDPPGVRELREAIEAVAPSHGGKPPSPVKLGGVLRRFRKRVVGERWFDSRPARAGSVRWLVDQTRAEATAAAE